MGKNNPFSEADLIKKGFTKDTDGNFLPPLNKSFVKIGSGHTIVIPDLNNIDRDDVTVKTSQIDENTSLGYVRKPLAVFNVNPIGKPRMTQQDKWRTDPNHPNPKSRQRKNVGLYWKYKAQLTEQALAQNFTIPKSGCHIIFYLPMPHSWSEVKKTTHNMSPHQQKPDVDNLNKAFFDSLLADDSMIWDCRITKYWGMSGKIVIYNID